MSTPEVHRHGSPASPSTAQCSPMQTHTNTYAPPNAQQLALPAQPASTVQSIMNQSMGLHPCWLAAVVDISPACHTLTKQTAKHGQPYHLHTPQHSARPSSKTPTRWCTLTESHPLSLATISLPSSALLPPLTWLRRERAIANSCRPHPCKPCLHDPTAWAPSLGRLYRALLTVLPHPSHPPKHSAHTTASWPQPSLSNGLGGALHCPHCQSLWLGPLPGNSQSPLHPWGSLHHTLASLCQLVSRTPEGLSKAIWLGDQRNGKGKAGRRYMALGQAPPSQSAGHWDGAWPTGAQLAICLPLVRGQGISCSPHGAWLLP